MILQDILTAIDHQITGGQEYGWDCFGPYARWLDCETGEGAVSAIFDSKTLQVYSIELIDCEHDRSYIWVDEHYRDVYAHEHESKNYASEDASHITIEVPLDILEKVTGFVDGSGYDDRIMIPLDFTDEELLKYMTLAHQLDMTFNEFITHALDQAIAELPVGISRLH